MVLAKTRVAPLSGTTIPRMELQSLLQATRILRKVVDSLEFPIERIILAGDSMCAILATQKDGVSFRTFFQNRLCEIDENLQYLKGKVQLVEPIRKIAGELNPVDLSTRTNARPADIQPESVWQKGPRFLLKSREEWPLTEVCDGNWIPQEEMKEAKYGSQALVQYVAEVFSIVCLD